MRFFGCLSAALVLLGGTALTAPAAVAAVPTVVLDSLTVPATVQPGQAVRASARVHSTSGNIAVQAITVAVRSSTGAAVDFPGAVPTTVPPGGYTFTSGTRTFPAGAYEAFVAVQIGGRWTNLTPRRPFTVAVATFSQDFNGPAGSSANHGLARPAWFNDPCWANDPACTGSLAQYKEDHARLDGQGSLVLTADRNPDPGAMCRPVRCTYATARLTMLDWAGTGGWPSWSQAGGHFEARIKAPAGRGLWPAFWLLGDQVDGTWPATGEIDIMEVRGNAPRIVEQHAHGGPSPAAHVDFARPGGGYPLPVGDTTGWHTYAVDWNASATGYIKWSVDGIVTHTLTARAAGANWSSFRGPQAIILDLAVGGGDGWIGPPDAATVFPAKMHVDYIRVSRDPLR